MGIRAALVFCFLLVVAPASAEPVGRYDVRGTNPGGGSYSGTVTVERTGETYRVLWIVGSQRYEGTAVGDARFLAVSYRAGNESGLALYAASGDDWDGVWTYAGGRQLGTERWSRR